MAVYCCLLVSCLCHPGFPRLPKTSWEQVSPLTFRSRGTACKLRLQVPSALRAPAAPHLYVRPHMLLRNRQRVCAALITGGVLLIACLYIWFAYSEPRFVLRTNLKLSQLPASVRGVECRSAITTDVLTDCDFYIEENDFPLLLTGRDYFSSPMDRSGVFQTGSMDSAPFPVTYVYRARTEGDHEFIHGGTFFIFADATRTRARTSLYIE